MIGFNEGTPFLLQIGAATWLVYHELEQNGIRLMIGWSCKWFRLFLHESATLMCRKMSNCNLHPFTLVNTKPKGKQKFRTISGNPRQFNYRDESAGLCISAH